MSPREIQVEITNDCPASCLMCSHRHMKRPVEFMDIGLIEEIVAEAIDIIKPPYVLGICGIGEPISHPFLKRALDAIKQVPFSLGTNGQLLDKERRGYVIDSKFTDITFSLDAVTAETHAKMRPGLDFNTVVDNVKGFLGELRNKDKFWRNIFIQFIPTKVNIHEKDAFIEHWIKEIQDIDGAKVFIKPMYQWPGLDNPFYPGEKVPIYEHSKILWGPVNEDTTFRKSCRLFDDYIGIQSDGEYQPCCMPVENEFRIGNVKEHTLMWLYNSPRMQELRKLFNEKRYDEIPFCSKCI